ncbi:hypothetical protein EV360DRAFT_77059 [Lentinula raphanica]|nr:hypothetical protein EV360DRAFT_77059 [Lentinula raphanica]
MAEVGGEDKRKERKEDIRGDESDVNDDWKTGHNNSRNQRGERRNEDASRDEVNGRERVPRKSHETHKQSIEGRDVEDQRRRDREAATRSDNEDLSNDDPTKEESEDPRKKVKSLGRHEQVPDARPTVMGTEGILSERLAGARMKGRGLQADSRSIGEVRGYKRDPRGCRAPGQSDNEKRRLNGGMTLLNPKPTRMKSGEQGQSRIEIRRTGSSDHKEEAKELTITGSQDSMERRLGTNASTVSYEADAYVTKVVAKEFRNRASI